MNAATANLTPGKLSIGKSIQTFYPNTNARTEGKKATRQADKEIDEANPAS